MNEDAKTSRPPKRVHSLYRARKRNGRAHVQKRNVVGSSWSNLMKKSREADKTSGNEKDLKTQEPMHVILVPMT